MRRYRVAEGGPVASVQLGCGCKLKFIPGAVVEAPEGSPYIQRQVRKGRLIPQDSKEETLV